MRIALTKHFDVDELLPQNFTDAKVLNPKLLILIDEVRELLGVPCTINNYAIGGDRQWCGYRTPECTIGAPHSYHKLGMAADLHPKGMTADDGRLLIRKAVAAGMLPLLGGVELGVSWIHIDVRPRVKNSVLWFKQ